MQELIRIEKKTIGDQEVNAVDARELHTALGVGRHFTAWIQKRIQKYCFVENVDWASLPQEVVNSREPSLGGRPSMEYVICGDCQENPVCLHWG